MPGMQERMRVVKFWCRVMLMGGVLLLSGCAAPLVPAPRVSSISRLKEPDDMLMEQMREKWFALQRPGISSVEYSQLVHDYNRCLLLMMRRFRADMLKEFREGNKDYDLPGIVFVHEKGSPNIRLRDIFDDIVPSCDVSIRALKEHYTVAGLGVPMVGIIPAENVSKTDKKFIIHTRGTTGNLTAIMEFPKDRKNKPRLRLIPRNRTDFITLGRYRHALAADFSAPIEIYWNLTRVKDDRLLGLLRPQKLRDVSGLSCIESYDPNKIPVILTHGLLSSAGTFDNLVNRLLCDPVIRQNYQFWYFNYPTGVTWTISAAQYRDSLAEARRQLDPQRKNRNWDNMVLVGHSMGGLITHYSQCVEPWQLLRDRPGVRNFLHARYVKEKLPLEGGDELRKAFFFEPVKAGMVVYMATPHQGAPLARYRLVTAFMKLVQLPQNIISEAFNIATLQEDTILLNPGKLTEAFTSVNQLSPDSYSIKGLQGLQVLDVPTHSIIGDQGEGDSPLSSDGVVPYWSSHISWGTETIVPADHSVQDISETASDFARVLTEHLHRCKRL